MTLNALHLPGPAATIRWREDGGGGPPVLYLPGLSFPAFGNFAGTVRDPALQNRSALLLDYLGSGDSDGAPGFAATLADHAACVAAVLDHLETGPLPVVGHSMGGSVGIALALARPDLVERLVVAEGNLIPGGGMATRQFASVSEDAFVAEMLPATLTRLRRAAEAGDSDRAFVAEGWTRADPRILHRNAVGLVRLPAGFDAAFLGLPIPRTFVYGETTCPTGPETATPDAPDPTMLRTHGVNVAIVPGTGHEMMLTNPAAFAMIVAQALA